jgi:hypothetical protein
MKEPLLILLGLFLLLGFAYGPIKNQSQKTENTSSRSSASVGKPTSSSSGSSPETPVGPNSGYSSAREVAEAIKKAEKEAKNFQKSVDEATQKITRSPYYGKVRLSNISGLRQSDPNREYITLNTSLKKDETLKITGWYLKSEITGYYTVIGGASLLPFPFTKNDSPVVLLQGDKVILTKGFSPVGISFRTNICTGYFEENRTFYPSLRRECPRPKDENLPIFSTIYDRNEECTRLIDRIPRCTTVDSEYLRDLPDTVTSSCKNYMSASIGYNACVAKHFDDTNFPGKEYRIYLGKFGPLWRTTHDTINLHDESGLIVDTIEY